MPVHGTRTVAQQIQRYLRHCQTPRHYRTIAARLGGRADSVRTTCAALARTGQLRRVAPGTYVLRREESRGVVAPGRMGG